MVGAEPREFAGLLPFCAHREALGWPVRWARSAVLNGRNVTLIANGAGPHQAGRAVEVANGNGQWAALCSTGFCGALDRTLNIGDIFIADHVAGPGGARFRADTPVSAMAHSSGTLASVSQVAQTADEKRELRRTGAGAVEMEAAGVGAKASELGVPFYCVRSVTDLADESFQFDFNAALKGDGRFDTIRIVSSALRRPMVLIPELLRLRNRCNIAARRLGEFLADCRF